MYKAALVLSGGGAGGAFQVGVLKKMHRAGIQFSHAYGTSVGALNAAGLRYLGIDAVEDTWLRIRGNSDIIQTRWLAYIGLADSLYKTNGLDKILDDTLKHTPRDIEAIACACNIITGETRYSYASVDADYREMLSASAAVPFYMPPRGEWVDGGMRFHTPLERAIHDGHKKIYVIVNNELFDESRLAELGPVKGIFKSLKYAYRATEWLQRQVFVSNNTVCPGLDIQWVYPQRRNIDTFEFNPAKIREAINHGFERARQLLGV